MSQPDASHPHDDRHATGDATPDPQADGAPANPAPSGDAAGGASTGADPAGSGGATEATTGAEAAGPADSGTIPTVNLEAVAETEERIVHALKTVYDPEIPVDIYELGLIYDIEVGADGKVDVKMTLTSPACPVAGSLPGEVEQKVQSVEGVEEARVELVWDPPWNPGMMSDAARLELGMF